MTASFMVSLFRAFLFLKNFYFLFLELSSLLKIDISLILYNFELMALHF